LKILSFFKDVLHKAYVNKTNRKKLIKKYGLKNGLPVIDFLEILPNYIEIIKPLSFIPGGSSSIIDYALLVGLARKFEKCRYLEIGTWRGESIACVASIAEECISISFSDEQMRDMGLSDEVIKNSRFFSKNYPNINHIEADSQTFDYSTIGKFDVIFVDGDHSYESIKKDTENIFPLLKDEKSIIVWHDYLWNNGKIRWETLRGILDGSTKESRSHIYHVSNTKSAVFINGKFKTKSLPKFQEPDKAFEIKLSVYPLDIYKKTIK